MSNYVKATDFASKDALTTGDPLKIIKGTEINTEFNAIQTAIATKADLASPAFTGNPTATTQVFGNSSTRVATTAFVQTALQALYPVGTIYTSVVSTNPNTLFGFGTWVAFATGRTLIGIDTGDTSFDVVEETGGSKDAIVVDHTHTMVSAGTHTHTVSFRDGGVGTPIGGSNGAGTLQTQNTSSAGAHTHTINNTGTTGTNANLPPYIVVYMWKRTA